MQYVKERMKFNWSMRWAFIRGLKTTSSVFLCHLRSSLTARSESRVYYRRSRPARPYQLYYWSPFVLCPFLLTNVTISAPVQFVLLTQLIGNVSFHMLCIGHSPIVPILRIPPNPSSWLGYSSFNAPLFRSQIVQLCTCAVRCFLLPHRSQFVHCALRYCSLCSKRLLTIHLSHWSHQIFSLL